MVADALMPPCGAAKSTLPNPHSATPHAGTDFRTTGPRNGEFHLNVKNELVIPVFMIHRGACRSVLALGLGGERPALAFLDELQRQNPKGLQILRGQLKLLCELPVIRARDTFKLLDSHRQLFEFRTRAGLRLYCFLDGDSLVVVTNGGKKNTRKEQDRDINRARDLHDTYLHLRRQGAVLVLTDF
jgi:hypothetical protein